MGKQKKGEMLSKMLLLVTQRFDGRYDKAGAPYVLHLLKVMHYLKTDDEELQIIALGHDLVEDTDTTYAELAELGFSGRVVAGIRNMTKMPGEGEDGYMSRLTSSPDSIRVKLADLRHNSDIRRLKGLTEKDFERMQKYHRMYLALSAELEACGRYDADMAARAARPHSPVSVGRGICELCGSSDPAASQHIG